MRSQHNYVQSIALRANYRLIIESATEPYDINHKRVLRLMRLIGIQAIYPKPNLSKLGSKKLVYAYLLKDPGAEALRKDFGASKLPKSLSPASAV